MRKSGPIEAVMAPELDQTPDLIFVTVSVTGMEVVALVDTGVTISCCRWEWYLEYQDHLGGVIKSNMRIVGVDSYPLKNKGLTKPLTLLWDGVGGKCQFRILTDLSDVDVVLGMDVLSRYNVEIDFRKQIARPVRTPCILSKPNRPIDSLLDNPDFTFKGKIPVKGEGIKEVTNGIGKTWNRGVDKVWMTSSKKRKGRKTKRNSRRNQRSSIPWNHENYKKQLEEELKDIRQKLGKIVGQDLGRKTSSFVEATLPIDCIEEGILVDHCGQRSEERGSGCDAPAEISDWPTSSDGVSESSKGLRTPVTPSLRPPKPQRSQARKYAWRNSSRKDVCMCIRMLKSSKTNEEKEELECLGSLNISKAPQLSQSKIMTSLSSRGQKAEERDAQSSRKIKVAVNNSVIGLDSS